MNPAAALTAGSKHTRSTEASAPTPKASKQVPIPSSGASSASATAVKPERVSQGSPGRISHKVAVTANIPHAVLGREIGLETRLTVKSGMSSRLPANDEKKQSAAKILESRGDNCFTVDDLIRDDDWKPVYERDFEELDRKAVQRELDTRVLLLSMAHGVSLKEAKMQFMIESFDRWFAMKEPEAGKNSKTAEIALFRWVYFQTIDVVQTYKEFKELIRRLNSKGYRLPQYHQEAFQLAILCRTKKQQDSEPRDTIRLLEIFIEKEVDLREARLMWAVESFDKWAAKDSSWLVNNLNDWPWHFNSAVQNVDWLLEGRNDGAELSKRGGDSPSHGAKALIRWVFDKDGECNAIQTYEEFCELADRLKASEEDNEEKDDKQYCLRLLHEISFVPSIEYFTEAKKIAENSNSGPRPRNVLEIAVIYQVSLEEAALKLDRYDFLNDLKSFIDFKNQKGFSVERFLQWLLGKEDPNSFVTVDQVEVLLDYLMKGKCEDIPKPTQEQLDLAHQMIAQGIQRREERWNSSYHRSYEPLIDEKSAEYKVLMTSCQDQISIDDARKSEAVKSYNDYLYGGRHYERDDDGNYIYNYLKWLGWKSNTFLVRTYEEFAAMIAGVNERYTVECPSEEEFDAAIADKEQHA